MTDRMERPLFTGRKLPVCCLRSSSNETRASRCRLRLEYRCSILKKHTRRQQLRTGYGKTMVSGWHTSTCDFQLLPSPSSTTIYFLPLINQRTTISQLYDSFGDFFFVWVDLIASFSRMWINRLQRNENEIKWKINLTSNNWLTDSITQ